jgi:hypothetical protein
MRMKIIILFILAVAAVLITLSGCDSLDGLFQNPKYLYDNEAVLVDGGDNPIQLVNNPNAVNVSFSALLTFIRLDPTDQIQYVDRDSPSGQKPFVCADFAEAVHNNAEAAGLRAGYVSIEWDDSEIGHAIDVFETKDMGTVYIDCTGRSQYSQIEAGQTAVALDSWDKVAYLEVGQEYGVIGIDYALSPAYSFYQQYTQEWLDLKQKLANYNADVKLYNQEIEGKVMHEGSLELEKVKAWEAELSAKEQDLNCLNAQTGDSRFRPLGIVKSFNIHW